MSDDSPSRPSAGTTIPLPVPTPDNAGFWEACRHHELRLQYCARCGAVRHPPRPTCPQCVSFDFEWRRASGRGIVYTFTIVHGPTLAAFQASAPYNVVVIQLVEGPFFVSNLVGCSADRITVGMPVEVVFEDVSDTVTLPKFRPAVA